MVDSLLSRTNRDEDTSTAGTPLYVCMYSLMRNGRPTSILRHRGRSGYDPVEVAVLAAGGLEEWCGDCCQPAPLPLMRFATVVFGNARGTKRD